MAKNFIDFELIEKLSAKDSLETVPMSNKIIKAQEEMGELSAAFLKFIGSKNVSASQNNKGKDDVLEEACDVINVVIDIINNLDYTDLEVREMFSKKLAKWERKTEAY